LFGGKNQVQKSRKTVPLIVIAHALEFLFEKLTGYVCSKKYVYNFRIIETVRPGSCPMFVEKLLSREIGKEFTFLTPVFEHQSHVKQEKSMCFNFLIFDKFCIFHSTYIIMDTNTLH